MCVPSFSFLGLTVPEKSATKNFNAWKFERKKNEEIKGWIRAAAWFRYTRYICQLSMCVPSFKLLGLKVPEKSVTKKINAWKFGEKEKWKNNGTNKSSSMIPVYTIHPPIVHVCNKFQPSRPYSSWEKCDKTFFNAWKLERKKNENIKGWIRAAAWFQYTRYIHCPPVYQVSIF